MNRILLAGLAAALGCLSPIAARAAEPIQVMVVATFHMGNPGQDLANAHYEDILIPRHQAEIGVAVNGLARFKPTQIDVEAPAKVAHDRYATYRAGAPSTSRNEIVQLAFRLAKQVGLETVTGVDTPGDFPFDAVVDYAKAHGAEGRTDAVNAGFQAIAKVQEEVFGAKGAAGLLRTINEPERIARDHAIYRRIGLIGAGTEQPGADLLTAWYHRNFLICANILEIAKPGDRIVVFYGSGHAYLLRQCMAETPGVQLVEANRYLP